MDTVILKYGLARRLSWSLGPCVKLGFDACCRSLVPLLPFEAGWGWSQLLSNLDMYINHGDVCVFNVIMNMYKYQPKYLDIIFICMPTEQRLHMLFCVYEATNNNLENHRCTWILYSCVCEIMWCHVFHLCISCLMNKYKYHEKNLLWYFLMSNVWTVSF